MSKTIRKTPLPGINFANQSLTINMDSDKYRVRNIAKLTLIARASSGAGKHQDRRLKRSGDRTNNWKKDIDS